jgi:acetyl-CoA acetyltransferase
VTGRRVAIVGASTSDFGRVDDKTAFQLNFQGTTRALADAGIAKDEVDGFMSLTGALPPVELAEYLGIRPNWVDSTGHGGSIWEFMVEHAAAAIAPSAGGGRGAHLRLDPAGRSQEAFAHGEHLVRDSGSGAVRRAVRPPGRVALRHGRSAAHVRIRDDVAVSARYNAGFKPDAYYRDPITIEDVLNSPMVWDPLTKLHCCIRSDGGGAVVLTSEERAKDCAKAPVWILGTGEAVSHATMSEWDDFTESPCVRSGELAFERAGVSREDIDTVQVYDAFTPMVILTLEGLGFCKKAARAVPSWRTAHCVPAVPCRPTRMAVGSRPASPACGAYSC